MDSQTLPASTRAVGLSEQRGTALMIRQNVFSKKVFGKMDTKKNTLTW
jgi:hypothetical protein